MFTQSLPLRSLLLALVLAMFQAEVRAELQAEHTKPTFPSTPSVDRPPLRLESPPDWILLGGGFDPLSNQISISQDLALAQTLLGGTGIALFAGGRSSPVAVIAEGEEHERLPQLLEELLGDPQATGIGFRGPDWTPDGPATIAHVLHVLGQALELGREELFVYGAGHGESGESPEACGLSLWGGWPLLAEDLGQLLDDPAVSRPLRLVLTSCFGGGFAHIAEHGGKELAHPDQVALASLKEPAADLSTGGSSSRPVHCGLFAAPWDDESSGCDPDPDRRSQESYGLHFLHALGGQNRDGRALPLEALDLDGDDRISLLEAHTRARIESRSIDLPTTTSEYWLRLHVDRTPQPTSEMFELLPEEQAVIAILGSALGLATAEEASERLRELDLRLEELATLTEEAQIEADDAYWALRITLLERWPELSQAWSSQTAIVIQRDHDALLELATESKSAHRYQQAMSDWKRRAGISDKLRLQRALTARVARSWQTLALATALHQQTGPVWEHYLELLRCERWVPATENR